MTEVTLDGALSSPRGWFAWSSLLISAYLVINLFGWQRTLIGTEIWALHYAGQPLQIQLRAIRGDLVHPPLMYMLERVWLGAFGQTDKAAKSLALLINLPTFYLFTWLAHRVTSRWRIASFLFLAGYLQVGGAPNLVRMYGLGLLLTVTAMVLWEKWCETPRIGTLVAWSFVATLLIYTHLFGCLLIIAFWTANLLCGPRRAAFTIAAAIPALTFLPWFLYVLPVYESRGLTTNLWWVPKKFSIGLGVLSYGLLGEFPFGSITARIAFGFLAALTNLTLLILVWRAARSHWPPSPGLRSSARWLWASTLLAGIPLLLIVLFSILVAPAMHWRFVLGVLPAYWLLVVLVCQESGRMGRLLLFGVFLSWVVVRSGASFTKVDIPSTPRQAAQLLARELQPSDRILCQSDYEEIYWELTHHFGARNRVEYLGSQPADNWLTVVPSTSLDSVDPEAAVRVWLYASKGEEADSLADSFLRRGFTLRKTIPVQNDVLMLFAGSGSP